MSNYAKAAASVKPASSPVPEKNHGLCCISGCQLPGVLSSGTLGASEWFCRLHFGSSYADQGKITALAANRQALYRLALRCTNVPPGRDTPPELIAAVKRHGRADLLSSKPPIQTVRTLGRHMLQVLDGECVQPHQREVVEEPKTESGQTWTPAGELAGVFAE